MLAGLLLLVVSAVTVAHWRHHPGSARAHAADPVMAHCYGAPPMVSAAAGALLIPELPAGQLPTTLFTPCWSMSDLSLLASLVDITPVWGRLARHEIGAATVVPTCGSCSAGSRPATEGPGGRRGRVGGWGAPAETAGVRGSQVMLWTASTTRLSSSAAIGAGLSAAGRG